ncbi:MAG: hypothetical protein JSS10_01675 [Verrucomicrobia bacterium]|nr:hypothetical protein [Verrucomicrobiota bacterium]
MSGKRIDLIDKNRFAAQEKLREDKSPSAIRSAAHRGPGKKSHHPDIKRGASLAKQSHPQKKDFYASRLPSTLLEELTEIRKTASALKRKKKKSLQK